MTRNSIGLGTVLRVLTTGLGIRTCAGCRRRAALLDRWVRLPTGRGRRGRSADGDCWRFNGSCTGFGSRQCVSGPERQEPDAAIIEQCCGGWFQYPWIEVCPGEPARTGCGFCFW